MKKNTIIFSATVIAFIMIICACLYQKMTSWEDQFGLERFDKYGYMTCRHENGRWHLVFIHKDGITLYSGTGEPTLLWNGVGFIDDRSKEVDHLYKRDWANIRPYFRWFFGGK